MNNTRQNAKRLILALYNIDEAYAPFENKRDGVIKVAVDVVSNR